MLEIRVGEGVQNGRASHRDAGPRRRHRLKASKGMLIDGVGSSKVVHCLEVEIDVNHMAKIQAGPMQVIRGSQRASQTLTAHLGADRTPSGHVRAGSVAYRARQR